MVMRPIYRICIKLSVYHMTAFKRAYHRSRQNTAGCKLGAPMRLMLLFSCFEASDGNNPYAPRVPTRSLEPNFVNEDELAEKLHTVRALNKDLEHNPVECQLKIHTDVIDLE